MIIIIIMFNMKEKDLTIKSKILLLPKEVPWPWYISNMTLLEISLVLGSNKSQTVSQTSAGITTSKLLQNSAETALPYNASTREILQRSYSRSNKTLKKLQDKVVSGSFASKEEALPWEDRNESKIPQTQSIDSGV